jgi:hypothetical protein
MREGRGSAFDSSAPPPVVRARAVFALLETSDGVMISGRATAHWQPISRSLAPDVAVAPLVPPFSDRPLR